MVAYKSVAYKQKRVINSISKLQPLQISEDDILSKSKG